MYKSPYFIKRGVKVLLKKAQTYVAFKLFGNFLVISMLNRDFICVIAVLFRLSNLSACLIHIFINSAFILSIFARIINCSISE
jgi:hypothetical protein